MASSLRALAAGRGRFLDDREPPGCLHVAFLRSPAPHARIDTVDAGRALALPGIRRVLTGEEAAERIRPLRARFHVPAFRPCDQPALAIDRVRYVGEPVAAVVAVSRALAEEAADLVGLSISPLEPVVDAESALTERSPLVHEEVEGNVVFREAVAVGDVDAAFARAAVVERHAFRSQRRLGCPIECRGSTAVPTADGRLEIRSTTQVPHVLRSIVAESLGYPEARIRVVCDDVGGGFGTKVAIAPEELVVAVLALELDAPVKWVEDRREHLLASPHGQDQRHLVEAAFDAHGRLLGLRARIVCDVGAYSISPWSAGLEPGMAAAILPGPYRVPTYAAEALAVLTNKAPSGPIRGVSRPPCVFSIERTLDAAARRLGLDRAEIRRRNLVAPDEFPFETVTGLVLDSGSYRESLDLLLEVLDEAGFRTEQEAARRAGRYLGLGYCLFFEQSALGVDVFRGRGMAMTPGYEMATVRVSRTGDVTVLAGISSQGQGIERALARLVAGRLGVPPECVAVLHSDTELVPYGFGAFASRAAVLGGGAAITAAEAVREKATEIAAHLLEASAADLEWADGAVRVRGSAQRQLTLAEIADTAYARPFLLEPGSEPGLESTSSYFPPPATFSNAAHGCIVEVDPELGSVRVRRYVVVEDCGTIVDIDNVEGQVHGGVVQGIGHALLEHAHYDEAAQPRFSTFLDYLLPTALDVPAVEVRHLSSPSPFTKDGIKGMGEGGALGPPAAIASAVDDALAPFGVLVTELPITPPSIRRLLRRAADPQAKRPDKRSPATTSRARRGRG